MTGIVTLSIGLLSRFGGSAENIIASAEAISPAWKDKALSEAGCRLSVKYEDETYYIRFCAPCQEGEAAAKEAGV